VLLTVPRAPWLRLVIASAEAETLTALLRRLPIVEPFPARGPGATNVHDSVRLVLRTRTKDSSLERFITLPSSSRSASGI
jgi:hypothetical protein